MEEFDYNGNYEVQVVKTREIPTGEKHDVQLVDKDSGEVVKEQTVTFSGWQLKDGYEDRLKHWAKLRIRDIETQNPNHEGRKLEI